MTGLGRSKDALYVAGRGWMWSLRTRARGLIEICDTEYLNTAICILSVIPRVSSKLDTPTQKNGVMDGVCNSHDSWNLLSPS